MTARNGMILLQVTIKEGEKDYNYFECWRTWHRNCKLGDDGVVGNLDVWSHGEIKHPLKHKKFPYGQPRNPNSWYASERLRCYNNTNKMYEKGWSRQRAGLLYTNRWHRSEPKVSERLAKEGEECEFVLSLPFSNLLSSPFPSYSCLLGRRLIGLHWTRKNRYRVYQELR